MDQLRDGDTTHVYLQVAAVIERAIASGEYPPGTRLPTRTTIAAHLAVAPMTVENAFRSLKERGIIYARAGAGTYVSPDATKLASCSHIAGQLHAEVERLRGRVDQLETVLAEMTARFSEVNPPIPQPR